MVYTLSFWQAFWKNLIEMLGLSDSPKSDIFRIHPRYERSIPCCQDSRGAGDVQQRAILHRQGLRNKGRCCCLSIHWLENYLDELRSFGTISTRSHCVFFVWWHFLCDTQIFKLLFFKKHFNCRRHSLSCAVYQLTLTSKWETTRLKQLKSSSRS